MHRVAWAMAGNGQVGRAVVMQCFCTLIEIHVNRRLAGAVQPEPVQERMMIGRAELPKRYNVARHTLIGSHHVFGGV